MAQIGPDTSRLAQVGLHMASLYSQMSMDTQRVKQAQAQAITSAINNGLRLRLAGEAQEMERERIGIAREAAEMRRQIFEEEAPLRKAKVARAVTEAERAEIETAFAKKVQPLREREAKAGVRLKELTGDLREAQADLTGGRILETKSRRIAAETQMNMDLLQKGMIRDPETGEVKWDPKADHRRIFLGGSAKMKRYLDQIEGAFHRVLAETPDGTQVPVPQILQGRRIQGPVVTVTPDVREMSADRAGKLGMPHVSATMRDGYRRSLQGPQRLTMARWSQPESDWYMRRNVPAGRPAETLDAEANRATMFALTRGLDPGRQTTRQAAEACKHLWDTVADAKADLGYARDERGNWIRRPVGGLLERQDELDAQILGPGGMTVATGGIEELRRRGEARTGAVLEDAQRLKAASQGSAERIWGAYVNAMRAVHGPDVQVTGYWDHDGITSELAAQEAAGRGRQVEVSDVPGPLGADLNALQRGITFGLQEPPTRGPEEAPGGLGVSPQIPGEVSPPGQISSWIDVLQYDEPERSVRYWTWYIGQAQARGWGHAEIAEGRRMLAKAYQQAKGGSLGRVAAVPGR